MNNDDGRLVYHPRTLVRGSKIYEDEYGDIIQKYSLSDIEEYFDNIDEPRAVKKYHGKIDRITDTIRKACGKNATVEISLREMKKTVEHGDMSEYDDEDWEYDEFIQVTYYFFYTIRIRSTTTSSDPNLLKIQYPELFQNKGEGIRKIIKQS